MYLLVGGSGIPNFGDEIIASNWINFIRSYDKESDIWLDCKDAEASETVVGSQRNLFHVSFLRRMAQTGKNLTFWENVKRGYEFIRKGGFGKHPRAAPLAEAIRSARICHIFGGGYINERWPTSGFIIGFAASLRELYGTRLAATGLGLMPLSPPRSWGEIGAFNRIITMFDIFDVRDAPSFRVVANAPAAPANNGLDDSFLEPSTGREGGGRILHVVVSFGEGNAKKMDPVVHHIAETLQPQFDKTLFWRCAPRKDDLAFEIFQKVCPAMEVIEVGDLVRGPLPIGSNDAMVTTRFHPHLFAARRGIPGYYLSEGDYYRVKHASVVELGSPFKQLQPDNLPAIFPSSGGAIVASDPDRVQEKRRIGNLIYCTSRT